MNRIPGRPLPMSLSTLTHSSRASLSVHVLIILFMAGVHNVFTQRYDFLQNTATSMNRTE